MNHSENTTIIPRKARLPNLKEQNEQMLVNWAAYGLERVAERFHLLARLSHGQKSSRWSRMASSLECAASQLRIGSCRCEELRNGAAQ